MKGMRVCEYCIVARDAARGLAAVDAVVEEEPELKEFLHFYQLDVTADQSIAELASYLQTTFGGVDILINNAAMQNYQSEAYEDAVDTIETNYFGTKRVTELARHEGKCHLARPQRRLKRLQLFRSTQPRSIPPQHKSPLHLHPSIYFSSPFPDPFSTSNFCCCPPSD